jgi:alpha-tubulin suppressor-like RCC1 family protein
VTVEEGQSASFEAAASGTPTPTVQWELSTNGGSTFAPVEGATSGRLTIASAKTSESGDEYRAVFTNVAGSATSKAATLTVQNRPVVTKQPTSVIVEEGQSASFEAAASGFPAPTVQWEVSTDAGASWKNVSKATSDELTLTDVKTSENGDEYRAVFKNAAGSATSEAATLTVHNRPAVTKQPTSVTVEEGQAAHFEAAASGFPAPSVQWELSTNAGGTWSPVEGATSDELAIASAKTSESGDEFRAVFTNAAGTATSAAATLTVHKAPAVTEQPLSVTVEVGQSASFQAAASGFPAPTVQWELSTNAGGTWSPVAGATSDELTIAEAKAPESADEYRAVFTNAAGKATSEAATLTVATHHYRVLAWGQNTFGQLGDGNLTRSDLPVPVSELDFVVAVAAGNRHSLALLTNGTVMAWGDGASGQLGDGEYSSSDVPVAVEGLTGVKAIAAGANFSLALLTNGTVMAWGANESGQLGDGSTEETDTPVPVRGLTGVSAIAAGGEHALALLSKGTVQAWGNDEHGQLGNGGTKNSSTSVNVKDLNDVTAVAAGEGHSLALLSDGTVMAWGSDGLGQLADSGVPEPAEEGEERTSDVPVAVEGVSGASAVAAGQNHSLALVSGGNVMAWGADGSGQLGDGSIETSHEAPVTVSGLTGVSAVSAGGLDSMALLGDGAVMTWGENKTGELGDGSAGEPSDVPVAVSALGEVAGIAAGGAFDLAYSEPLPTVSGVEPSSGSTEGGTEVTITGSNLEGATSVHFGANAATSVTVHSPSSITAVAPAGPAGTVNVTVTTPAGTSPSEPADRFTYVLPPTVKKLSSKKGPGNGGTPVTITGTNFTGATSVHFGTASAHFTVNSATSIAATAPAGGGTVNVTVTTAGGASATSKNDEFEYIPAVEGIEPDSGPTSGGTSVTITGYGFAVGAGATTFKFKKGSASEVDCSSSTTCTATTPAGKAGMVEVTAEVGKAKSSANPPDDRFSYE